MKTLVTTLALLAAPLSTAATLEDFEAFVDDTVVPDCLERFADPKRSVTDRCYTVMLDAAERNSGDAEGVKFICDFSLSRCRNFDYASNVEIKTGYVHGTDTVHYCEVDVAGQSGHLFISDEYGNLQVPAPGETCVDVVRRYHGFITL